MVLPEWRDNSIENWNRHRAGLAWGKLMEDRGSAVARPSLRMHVPLPDSEQPYEVMLKTTNGGVEITLVEAEPELPV